ncbi:MAG: hypothetical protein QM831_26165 [Kofleriaceae bacterium]
MPAPNRTLLMLAEGVMPVDNDVSACWSLVMRGIEVGWIGIEELDELDSYLRQQRDWGVEELLFANLGDDVRVDFVSEQYRCKRALLVRELDLLLAKLGRR